jgi:pSer/pThr/pTyr-binding forkhead associated (FHA) protein
LRGPITRLGRDRRGDIVFEGREASIVSARHCEIRRQGNTFRLYDLNSTNGTYVDGQRVSEAELRPDSVIRLGAGGPRLVFELDELSAEDLEKTVQLPPPRTARGQTPPPAFTEKRADPWSKGHDTLLSDAVTKAREARDKGSHGQTLHIMREMLRTAIGRSGKKFKIAIGVLVVALLGVSGYGYWRIQQVQREKSGLDQEIERIEEELASGELGQGQVDQLMEQLDEYQRRALALQKGLLFRWGILGEEQLFIQREIRSLMEDFGAEAYSIPPEFIGQVREHIERYQSRDRKHVERILGRSRDDLEQIRGLLREDNLPPDLAYMVLVESAFLAGTYSRAGAAGPWQFTAATARQYGMTVSDDVDERHDLVKSTRGASQYIRNLILDFGSGSSVMLALAAYNVGPGKVKRAVRKVKDPIKQRNFWYLYRTKALPRETREYVPKIIAAIIIGRNPERFGF